MVLKIAPNFSLPIDAVTQAIGVLAKRRAGKSYTARRIAEELYRAKQQIVIIDPKGDWWGIRSSSDGHKPGLAIPIVGGEHGDIRLEPSAGEVVARLAVEESISLLLDLSLFRKHEVATFMTAFLENLYRLKAQEKYRSAMMLMIDEADAVAPQKPQKGEERMLGAAEDIVRRGGQRGIGCTLVTQRSAVLNKNVLTQVEMLVALRTIAPQDLDAMKAWIDVHGTIEQQHILMESLPALPIGDAWFWSPGWPTAEGIFQRVHVSPITTLDSGATPKPGERKIEAKTLADVDMKAFEMRMAATIERQKSEDPRELRKQIADLKRELAAKPKPAIDEAAVDRAVKLALDKERREADMRLGKALRFVTATERAAEQIQRDLANAKALFEQADVAQMEEQNPRNVQVAGSNPAIGSNHTQNGRAPVNRVTNRVTSPSETAAAGPLTGPQRKILTTLAFAADLGKSPCTRAYIAILSGYSANGGAFKNPLSHLRTLGYVSGAPDAVEITSEGLAALGHYDAPPHGAELREFWLGRSPSLGGPERRILRALCEVYPGDYATPEELAAACDPPYEPSGGAFKNPLSLLRTLQLAIGRGPIKASPDLFD